MSDLFSWPAHPVPVGLKFSCRPCTIEHCSIKARCFGKTPGNQMMGDVWLCESDKPSGTRQAGHDISGGGLVPYSECSVIKNKKIL
jgi:hypothetical protein